MLQLLNIVNKNNILKIDFVNDSISLPQKLRNLLDYCETRETIVDKQFIVLFKDILDNYSLDIEDKSEKDSLREFKNYLSDATNSYKESIISFIRQFGKLGKRKFDKIVSFLTNIVNFQNNDRERNEEDDDEIFFKEVNYLYNCILYIVNVFPSVIINKANFDNIKLPNYWGLSDRHKNDIKEVIQDNYVVFKNFYNDDSLSNLLEKIRRDCIILKLFANITPKFIDIQKNDGSIIEPILDKRSIKLLYEYYFYLCLNRYVNITDDINIFRNSGLPRDTDISDIINFDEFNNLSEQALEGNQILGKEKISKLLIAYYEVLSSSKSAIDFTVEQIKEKVNRSKDREKDSVTKKLGELTIEEREIEELFKKHRLERWDKGLQKGLVEYVAKTYDEERQEEDRLQNLEKRAIARNMGIEELGEIERVEQEVDDEEYDITNIPEDDDYNDQEDENYRLEFEQQED